MLTAEHDVPYLPWPALAEKLEPMLIAFPNLLEREPPQSLQAVPGAPHVVSGLTHLAINTHRAIRFISAAVPPDPSRKLEYSLVVPALSRTILDGLFTLVFLLEDLPARTGLYYRGGWRELREEHDRYQASYGSQQEWKTWLDLQAFILAELQQQAAITPDELAAPSSVRFWPIPSGILKDKSLSPGLKGFLQHLYDWFYRDLSQASHLSFPALAELAAPFFFRDHPDTVRGLDKRRSDWFVTSLILLLCHLSELEHAFSLGRREPLTYCWTLLTTDFLQARELYDRRYKALLTPVEV